VTILEIKTIPSKFAYRKEMLFIKDIAIRLKLWVLAETKKAVFIHMNMLVIGAQM
jgi:hypothetical protein